MSYTLPARPRRFKHENIIGYLLRLAKANSFESLQECLRFVGKKASNIGYLKQRLHSWFDVASELTGQEVEYHGGDFIGHFEYLEPMCEDFAFTLSRKPIICPDCVLETGFIKSEWQFTPSSFCRLHRKELVNVCPHCKQELIWNTSLLEGKCQRCGGELADSNNQEVPYHIKQFETLQGPALERYIKRLLSVVSLLIRPHDLIQKPISASPMMLENWNGVYSLAAQYLECGGNIPDPYTLAVDEAFQDAFKDFAVSSLANSLYSVSKKKLSNIDVRYLVDVGTIEKWTGINSRQIQYCCSANLLTVEYKKPYCGTLLYDFRELLSLLSNVKEVKSNEVSLSEVEDEAPIFWADPDAVIIGILKGKIPCNFILPERPHFAGARIDQKAAHYYLRKQRGMKLETVVPTHIAFAALGISLWEGQLLLDDKKLNVLLSNDKSQLVATDSIRKLIASEDFPRRLEVLNRHALEINIPSTNR